MRTNSQLHLRASPHGVPSPFHVSKSHHGGKVPKSEHQETIKIWFTFNIVRSLLLYARIFARFSWELGLSFFSAQLSTQVLNLTFKNCCQVGIYVILGTLCEVISPNFHALNNWDCTVWLQVTWDLGLGPPCELALRWQELYRSSRINEQDLAMMDVIPRNDKWINPRLPTLILAFPHAIVNIEMICPTKRSMEKKNARIKYANHCWQ